MALPRSLVQPIRQGQLVVGHGWRAFFAPFNRALAVTSGSTTDGPKLYDLLVQGQLIDNALSPASGWYDLGLVRNFRITPGSKIGNIVTGYRGVIRAKYRAEVGEKISFEFGEMSRTALRIASGSQVFNALYNTTPSTVGPLSASGVAAVAIGASGYVASGSVANYVGEPTLYVATGSGATFAAGQYIVCDQDYNNTTYGFVGDAGANVFNGAVTDVDFIRKTSDYIAGIKAIVGDALVLTNPFVGGGNAEAGTAYTAPRAGAKVQRVTGYITREGGSYISEWSAMFCLDTIDSSQILFYYPRLSLDTFGGWTQVALQNATAMSEFDMPATFDAMAYDDPLDGETVVRYAAYYPRAFQSIGI
jgi:hypothetical protein